MAISNSAVGFPREPRILAMPAQSWRGIKRRDLFWPDLDWPLAQTTMPSDLGGENVYAGNATKIAGSAGNAHGVCLTPAL